jgi:sodium/potassium-transporting ATPase subunit alpha
VSDPDKPPLHRLTTGEIFKYLGISEGGFGWFSNPLILWGVVIELTILAVITYTSLGNDIFRTGPLPAWIFWPLALGALVLLFAEESRKIIVNRFNNGRAGRVTQQAGKS